MVTPSPRLPVLASLLALAFLSACGGSAPAGSTAGAQGSTAPPAAPPPYVSPVPIREPRLFASGVVSTEAPEFSLTFEPDGRTAYFNRASADRKQLTILVARWLGDRWASEVAPFSGKHRDIDPFVTADGHRLYFSSDRPRPGAPDRTDLDLWYVERDGPAWGEPRHVAGPPNDPDDIGFVSLARDGTLYFDAFHGGVRGMFRSAPADGGFAAPEPLTHGGGSNPLIAPDGGFLLFAARRDDSLGESDIYLTRRFASGAWTTPRSLGPLVNTSQREFAPALSPDGRYLFFTSERPGIVPTPAADRPPGDIYQIELSALPAD
jgi:hypothetical protein